MTLLPIVESGVIDERLGGKSKKQERESRRLEKNFEKKEQRWGSPWHESCSGKEKTR